MAYFCNWGVAVLQRCVNFCCASGWISREDADVPPTPPGLQGTTAPGPAPPAVPRAVCPRRCVGRGCSLLCLVPSSILMLASNNLTAVTSGEAKLYSAWASHWVNIRTLFQLVLTESLRGSYCYYLCILNAKLRPGEAIKPSKTVQLAGERKQELRGRSMWRQAPGLTAASCVLVALRVCSAAFVCSALL